MSAFGFLLVLSAALITMAANLLMRVGIDHSGGFQPKSVAAVLIDFLHLLLNPLFALGFAGYFLAALVWFRILAMEPLSLAYPVLVGMTFILVSSGAVLLLGEPVSIRKVLGLVVIAVGIAMMSTEGPPHGQI